MVPPTDRLRLFDTPLTTRLETAPKLQVLWLQTVQLIANRHNQHPLQRVETDSSGIPLLQQSQTSWTFRVRFGWRHWKPTVGTNNNQEIVSHNSATISNSKRPLSTWSLWEGGAKLKLLFCFPWMCTSLAGVSVATWTPAGDRNINMAFTNWQQQKWQCYLKWL